MAYFTGKDVDVWITTEHTTDCIGVYQNELIVDYTDHAAGTFPDVNTVMSGSLDMAGDDESRLTDVSGCDLSIGAVDEDISFFGLRNVGKIEVKKETSVTITRKKTDNRNMIAFQGMTSTSNKRSGASTIASATSSYASGKHSARWGLVENSAGNAMVISDGTIDPKSAQDDKGTPSKCYGWRVFIELKSETAADDGDGVVMIIPNCTMMEYSETTSNESANEETFTFASMVKPIIFNGSKDGNGIFKTNAIAQTTASKM